VIEEVKKDGNIILFIDEIHTIIGAGASEGSMDAANILKANVGERGTPTIGAITLKSIGKHYFWTTRLAGGLPGGKDFQTWWNKVWIGGPRFQGLERLLPRIYWRGGTLGRGGFKENFNQLMGSQFLRN